MPESSRTGSPRLSVVMPVHNALPFLDAAIESILSQSFSDFEFVILDDASSDGSLAHLREWAEKDRRIRLIEQKANLGPAASSDRVARAAVAPLVARMDADDISCPERLERQVRLLAERPDVGLVGSLYETIDRTGTVIRGPERWRLAANSAFAPFVHGSIMYRREIFDRIGGYRVRCEYWEDEDLFTRFAAEARVVVLSEPLYRYRQSPVSTRIASARDRVEGGANLMFRCKDRMAIGEGYEDLLDRPPSGKIDPRVFIATGSVELWSGRRPHLFRRLLRKGRLSLDRRTVGALAWTAWASIHPSSLRSALQALAWGRNSTAPPQSGEVEWAPAPASRKRR